MRKTILATLIMFSIWITVAPPGQSQMKTHMESGMMMTKPAMELGMAMRVLWEDHITYTRNYIISSLAGLEDAGKVAERLLRNQDDIGNAIKPDYGEQAGMKLFALLRTIS